MRCPWQVLFLGVVLVGCDEDQKHRKQPSDTEPQDSDPRDSPPPDSAPGDTAPDSPADTAPEEHVPNEGEQDLEAAAGVSMTNVYTDLLLQGEFSGDDVPDYVIINSVFAGPLPPVLDFEDDNAVTARIETEGTDWWRASAATGQLEGDGYSDLVQAGEYNDIDGAGWYGAATFIYHGPLLSDRVIGEDPGATLLYSGELEQRLGMSSSLGDTDGDGRDDLLLGSPAAYPTMYPRADDAVYLFRGPVSGTHDVAEADTIFVDPAGTLGLGKEVNLHGDFDGDGTKDAVMVAFEVNHGVFVFNGPPPTGVIDAGSADAILSPYRTSYWDFSAGDHDRDGYDDLVVADAGAGGGGLLRIFNGPLPVAFTLDDWQVFIQHSQTYAEFGNSVSLEQDLDGDGRDDLVAAAPRSSSAGGWNGGAYVYYGPLEGSIDADEADAVYRIWAGTHPFAVSGPGFVAPGGDVNLDGYEDFFSTGCVGDDTLSCDGRTYAIFGGPR